MSLFVGFQACKAVLRRVMRKLNVEILKQNITSRAEKQLNENRFSGASAAVYQNGERVFKGCFGDADDGTLYRIASMTKPITAAAVLKPTL